jgi:iron complex outermembrane recepter protein
MLDNALDGSDRNRNQVSATAGSAPGANRRTCFAIGRRRWPPQRSHSEQSRQIRVRPCSPSHPIHQFLLASLLTFTAAASLCCNAQSPATTPTPPSPKPSKPVAQSVEPVTTTVVVQDEVKDDYLPESVTVGTLDGVLLKDAPISATIVTRDLLNDQVARLISDVVNNDASVGDDYVPVGYYGDYQIRGFPIDLATGFEINGMTIAGEQDVPLENKESVEILKGIAGVESGVTSAGGLIDYVTKRPATVGAVDMATDHRGTAYGALDLGRFFASGKQVGVRMNLAGERIVTYMNDTNGWRAVGAGAVDWKLSPKAILKGDFEYQHKTERDGSGYQLLGGTALPDISKIYPSTMLGDQPWGPPDTYDTFNTGARFDYSLPRNWLAFVQAGLSHSLIQDNVIYAYGSSLDADGNVDCPNAPNAPAYFFCPDGTYGIYDYRDPGELRIDAEAQALVTGHIKTGAIEQDLAGGGEIFLRSVQEPGAPPATAPSTVQDGAVYAYVGAENIYQPIAPIAIESPLESAGPRTLWEDNHQSSAIVQDRVRLPGRIQLLAGGREDSLRDNNYSLTATSPSTAPTITDKLRWLPQYAATFNPIESLTFYGNYNVMLSLGPEGPWWVDNASQFLAPYLTRQAEIGAKYEPGRRILLSTALFHMRAPFFYPKVIQAPDTFCTASEFTAPGGLCLEQKGRETHNGIELNAQGKATNWLRLTGSAMAIRALSTDTGTPSFDNKQVINVPHLHSTVFADFTVPHLRGLHLMPGWGYTSRKEATRDDAVAVPSYNLFNFGARYTPGGEQGHVSFHIYANNIADKRYWSDTGASYGDMFVWLGAPTTVRLSAHYTF